MELIDKRLLVISRASFRTESGHYYFHHLDGPYLDKISSFFSETVIISTLVTHGWINNISYSFENKVILKEFPAKRSNSLALLLMLFQEVKKADVIFVFMPLWRSFVAGCIARILHKKIIYYSGNPWHESVHLKFERKGKKSFLLRSIVTSIFEFIESALIRWADIRILNNNQLYIKYSYLPFTEKTKPLFKVIYDDIFYRPDTCQKSVINIVAVGHVIPRKGYEFLIKGFAEFLNVCRDRRTFKLNIIGNNTYNHDYICQLDQLIFDLNVGNYIKFYGEINDKEKYLHLLREMDIFVLSSLSEGFPRVLWEAMSQSLPIIASDLQNIRMEIASHPGLVSLVEPANASQIRKALRRLVADSNIRSDMIRRQHDYLKDILSETAEEQLIRLYHENLRLEE
jgi:glycosyltransferase involved in cell wall biosynthesis